MPAFLLSEPISWNWSPEAPLRISALDTPELGTSSIPWEILGGSDGSDGSDGICLSGENSPPNISPVPSFLRSAGLSIQADGSSALGASGCFSASTVTWLPNRSVIISGLGLPVGLPNMSTPGSTDGGACGPSACAFGASACAWAIAWACGVISRPNTWAAKSG